MRLSPVFLAVALLVVGCSRPVGTEPPPEGWANAAPTVVEKVVERGEQQASVVQ